MLVNKQDIKYTLWFDVEERYKTNLRSSPQSPLWLWFDVEERYKTNNVGKPKQIRGCGLM